MDLDMDFLHNGLPETPLKSTFKRGGEPEHDLPEPGDYAETILHMLSRLNICSKEFVAAQYDHNVQGSAVLGPLQGPGRVFAEATVSKPVLNNPRGVVLSQGLAPRYSDIDTGAMAAASLDIAVRNAVASGCPIDHLAILDNFCWCSSEEPERLGQLKRACEAIYGLSVLYKTPFISGKDSMFNDFKGYDADNEPVKISILPTLLVSGIGVIENVDQAVSLDPKAVGDLVYVLGTTKDELGASEYYDLKGRIGSNVPETNGHANLALYQKLTEANKERLCASAMAVTLGGIGVTLAKKCIASGFGMDITPQTDLRLDRWLFSESTGRIIVTVAPKDKGAFEKIMGDTAVKIGTITENAVLKIGTTMVSVRDMDHDYKKTLKDF